MAQSQTRIEWIDIARAIAIVMVMVGHMTTSTTLGNVMYAVELSVFFVLSGFLYREKSVIASIKSGIQNLLIPYFFSIIVLLSFSFLYSGQDIVGVRGTNGTIYGLSGWDEQSLTAVMFAPGWTVDTFVGKINAFVGPLWFLPAFFILTVLYNVTYRFIGKRVGEFNFSIVVLSMLVGGVLIGHRIFLPWSLNAVLVSMSFVRFGHLFRQSLHKSEVVPKIPMIVTILGLLLWAISVHEGRFSLSTTGSSNWMIMMIAGAVGTLTIIRFSIMLDKRLKGILKSSMSWLGANSMTVFAVHGMSLDTLVLDTLKAHGIIRNFVLHPTEPVIEFGLMLVRIILIILISGLLLKLPIIQCVFNFRKFGASIQGRKLGVKYANRKTEI